VIYVFINVPAFELLITDPAVLAVFILAHILIALSFVCIIYWKRKFKSSKEIKKALKIAIVAAVITLFLLYFYLGII